MKRLIIIVSLLTPLFGYAQEKERFSKAYFGAMLHNIEQPGVSLVNSFGFNQFVGLGAGVDLTSYKGAVLVPVYADIRIKYPINDFAPFLFGQFGKPLYSNKEDDGIDWRDVTGTPTSDYDQKVQGKYFYGGGIGVAYKKSKIGFFLTYTLRNYHFAAKEFEVNGRTISPKYEK